jgi:cytochrome c553
VPDTLEARLRACVGCHGDQGRATRDGYHPRIAGKPAGYLANQLLHFRDGRRAVPSMTWMLEGLPDAYLRDMAGHFAALNPPYPPPPPPAASAAELERGRLLATVGDPARDLPACTACHGEALLGTLPAVPGLLGLPRDYLNAQFGAWREGTRRAFAPDCMATIARRMAVADIAAVTAWLASRPVPPEGRPAATGPERWPLECGGVDR